MRLAAVGAPAANDGAGAPDDDGAMDDDAGEAGEVGEVALEARGGSAFARLALAECADAHARRRQQTKAARAAKLRKCAATAVVVRPATQAAQQLCSPPGLATPADAGRARRAVPRSADLVEVALGEGGTTMTEVRAAAMQCLAFMPRVRGRADQDVQLWQKRGACLLASCIQATQARCFRQFSRGFGDGVDAAVDAEQPVSALLALNCMWDEATQRLRSTLANTARRGSASLRTTTTTMPVSNTTMVSLAKVFLDLVVGIVRVEKWEPWVMPLRFFPRANTEAVLHSLLSAFPLPLERRAELDELLRPFRIVFLTLGFDSAKANILVYKYMLTFAHTSLPPAVVILGEPCLMHQVHIVKSSAFALGGLAATLYSSSKLMRLNYILHTLQDSIHDLVSQSLRVEFGPGPADPEDNEIMTMATLIFGIDGDQSILYASQNGQKRATRFLEDLRDLCMVVQYDRAAQQWVCHTSALRAADADIERRSSRVNFDEAVTVVCSKLHNVLFSKAWPVAVLSRWTHVVEALKRVTFGAALGGILVKALGALAGRLRIDDASVAAAEEDVARARAQAAGGEVDDSRAKRLSRVLRVSKFWSPKGVSWQTAVVLVCTVTIDRLAQRILGHSHQAVTLSDLVDPGRSVVATTASQCLSLLQSWIAGGPWSLLQYMEAGAWRADAAVRAFTRRLIVALSCSLFHRLTLRLSQFPYRLQWILSPAVTGAERDAVCNNFIGARRECLPMGLRKLRDLVPEASQWQGDMGRQIVELLQKSMTFSTHPVELEHKYCRDDLASDTSGAAQSHVGNRTQCRQFRGAFLAKGNPDIPGLRCPRSSRDVDIAGPTPAALAGQSAHLQLADGRAGDAPDAAMEPSAGPPEPLQLARRPDIRQLSGGNPKFMYLNHYVAVEARHLEIRIRFSKLDGVFEAHMAVFETEDLFSTRKNSPEKTLFVPNRPPPCPQKDRVWPSLERGGCGPVECDNHMCIYFLSFAMNNTALKCLCDCLDRLGTF